MLLFAFPFHLTASENPKPLAQQPSGVLIKLLLQEPEQWTIATDESDVYGAACCILIERREAALLLKALDQAKESTTRIRLISLGLYQIQDDRITKVFRSRLKEREDEESYYLANYLAKLGDNKALDILNRHYGHYPVSSWQWATTVGLFGIHHYEPALQNLIKSLDAASLNVVEAAFGSLRAFFPEAPPKFDSIEDAKKYFYREAVDKGGFRKYTPNVSLSAQGWALKPKPYNVSNRQDSTILINPHGEEFNIGPTPYPDILESNLWIVRVPELKTRFLLIHTPPAASGAVAMPVIYLSSEDKPILSGTIRQRMEIKPDPDDLPTGEPRIRSEGKLEPLRDFIFEDSDGDGVPELAEHDFWKENGTVTYYRFTKDKKFVPFWREKWRLSDKHDGYEMISRTKVGDTTSK
jgi:hypothetical protein